MNMIIGSLFFFLFVLIKARALHARVVDTADYHTSHTARWKVQSAVRANPFNSNGPPGPHPRSTPGGRQVDPDPGLVYLGVPFLGF